MSIWTRRFAMGAAIIIAAAIAAPASAQTKLKWAHVYEIAEPYHTEALCGRRGNQEAHQRAL